MSLGLTEYEAKVYAALLASGSCTVKEISFKSDVPRTKIYPTLKGLERRGMILFLPEEPVKCKALPPDIALSPKVSQQEESLRRTKRALSEIKKAYESYKITEDLERQELWVLKRDQAIQNKLMTNGICAMPSAMAAQRIHTCSSMMVPGSVSMAPGTRAAE